MNMKRIALFSSFLVLLLIGCDMESPMEQDLYPQKVYIIGAHEKIINRDLNIGFEQDTILISVGVSGSRTLNQDVTVTLEEIPGAIDLYNSREVSATARQYRNLPEGIYTFPFDKTTVKSGATYGTYPIYIEPKTLHCDSLYMLAFKLASTSVYELTEEDTVALVRINLVNEYSGLYYMDGMLRNMTDLTDSLSYKMPRNLVATDNGRTVRMFHYNNEWIEDDVNDYRPTHTFKITVNEDNTLSYTTWDKFDIIDGGGIYNEEYQVYDLWYTYRDKDVVWKAEGYLYKERKTEEEQRIIQDWIEDQKAMKIN